MQGTIWAATPLGVLYLNVGHPALPFTRCEITSWLELGAAWDAIPRAVQRELEAAGIGRRSIEEPLVREYFRAARAAGW